MQLTWVDILIWGATSAFALFNIITVLRVYRKVKVSESWMETVGTITSVDTNFSDSWADRKNHWAEFGYSYSAFGSVYTGKYKIKKIDLFGSSDQDAQAASMYVETHPKGSTIDVRYNPEKPQETITEFDKVNTSGLITSVAFFLLVTIYLFIFNGHFRNYGGD